MNDSGSGAPATERPPAADNWKPRTKRAILAAPPRPEEPTRAPTAIPRPRLLAFATLVAGVLACAAEAGAATSITLVGGTEDPVDVMVGAKKVRYYRVAPGGEKLVVNATGPVALSIRVRALRASRATGTLRILRDDGPFSDNAYDLAHDEGAKVDTAAATESGAATEEKVLHVSIPDGAHRYALAPVKGPALLLRVLKTSNFDPSLATAPEKNVAVALAPPPAKKAPRRAEPEPAPEPEADAEDEGFDAPPPPAAPDLQPVRRGIIGIERAPAARRTDRAPAGPQPSTDVLVIERPAPVDDGVRRGGFALAVKGGALAFSGHPAGVAPAAGASILAARGYAVPGALELAWDLEGVFSLFAEGSYFDTENEQVRTFPNDPDFPKLRARTRLRVAPLAIGLTVLARVTDSFALRFRAGGAVGFVEAASAIASGDGELAPQPALRAPGFGGLGAISAEYAAGPGRVLLEARWLALRTDLALRAVHPAQPFNAQPGDVGGPQLLAGYRLEL